jgi:hypothetical protein
MSLNKFTDDLKEKEWMKINCDTIIADNVKFRTTDGNIINLKTPTLGGNNYVLTTDGAGNCAFIDIGILTPPDDPLLYSRTQNIDNILTVAGNTQINGTTKMFNVIADTDLKVKTGDGLGYNNFSTPTMGSGGYVLSTDGSGNLSWVSNGVLSIADLEAKTQNISLANTYPNITQLEGTLRIPLLTSHSGGCQIDLTTNTITATATTINLNSTTLQQNSKDLINTDGNKNITNTLTTTQTVFTLDQELITKKYVDDNAGGGGVSTQSYFSFLKNVNNSVSGFYNDGIIQIGWDGFDEIMLKLPVAKTGVYATGLAIYGGTYPSTQHMLLSTVLDDFYQNSSIGQIEFTISCDGDNTFPFYKVRFHISGNNTSFYCYCIVEKF